MHVRPCGVWPRGCRAPAVNVTLGARPAQALTALAGTHRCHRVRWREPPDNDGVVVVVMAPCVLGVQETERARDAELQR
eukprot:COSAG01_NODE_4032_length_5416_cov_11.025954_6_plen_79_part_00